MPSVRLRTREPRPQAAAASGSLAGDRNFAEFAWDTHRRAPRRRAPPSMGPNHIRAQRGPMRPHKEEEA
jgi:hypothetical protein